ncbi:UNVERIFIED_CONTAM: hypothetical protein Slati_1508200 [Sesamum latifolium]|uniref:Retrotransposon gag domain-containing protein n=1 Tax=Sesamum latifolium TaxID=2727402 RepID=A0AAW2X6M6_9LAMI
MAWFNQLPPGTVETFEQLSQRFLHHFAINKWYPKTASYLFTIVQHEHEGLREYVQRFKESISGKPPATKEELLARAEKYIRIEETAGKRSMTPMKRKSTEEEGVMPPKAEKGGRERKHMPPNNLAYYTSLSVPRAELLAVAIQQGQVCRPPPMQTTPRG